MRMVVEESSKKKRNRRRDSSEPFLTSCHSSNRKRLPRLHPQHPLRWSATATESEADLDLDLDFDTHTRSSTIPNSSDLNLLMMSNAALPSCRCDSSFGSCGAFSFASLDDKCPATPSPICSPISSDHLFDRSLYPFQEHQQYHTPPPHHLQGFSTMASTNGCKNIVQGEEEVKLGGRGSELASSPHHEVLLFSTPSPIQKMRSVEGGEKQQNRMHNYYSNINLSGRSSRSGGCSSYLHYMNDQNEINMGDNNNNNNNNNNNCTEDINGGRSLIRSTLPVLVEDQKEDRGCNNNTVDHPAITQSSHFSAVTQAGSSRSSGSEEYDGSSEEIEIQEERVVRPRNRFVPDIRTELEAKLTAWKEAKTRKLLNRLRKEEAEIEEWERKEMAKAKMEMKELEKRLEKQRERAMMRMQRRITNTKKEAEQRLHRERSSTAQKISSVSRSFDKINNTGKLSWKLICF